MRTIDDAELHGFTGLHVTCPCHSKELRWNELRRRPWRELQDIAIRLTCKRCGPPTSVELFKEVQIHAAGPPMLLYYAMPGEGEQLPGRPELRPTKDANSDPLRFLRIRRAPHWR